MLQIDTPFPNIFKLAFIHQESQSVIFQSYICSQNKQFIALFNNFGKKKEIIVYKLADGIWTEYFKNDDFQYSDTIYFSFLICFANDDNQILMYQPVTNTIKVLKLEQSFKNGLQNITGFVDDYFKFQDQPENVAMISSSNGKFILIKTQQMDLLFDVNQVEIIAQFDTYHHGIRDCLKFMYFFNDRIILQVYSSLRSKIYQFHFYNMRNQKIKKIMCFKEFHHSENYIIKTNNQYISLLFQNQMMNIINQKMIRKIRVENNEKFNIFLSIVDKYYLIRSIDDDGKRSYLIMDLFSLHKQESQFDYHCQYKNEIFHIFFQNCNYFCIKI